jgi:hypothetical protein
MSSKNFLQELCIKNKHSAPVYDSKKIGGEAHDPKWFSTVTVMMCPAENAKKGQSISIPGEVCSSKTEAEKSAAQIMLDSLTPVPDEKVDGASTAGLRLEEVVGNTPVETPASALGDDNLAILVDVENMPNMIFSAVTLIQKHPKANIRIFACVGKHHHSAGKNFGKHVTKIVVPTTRKDGVDTFIQMYVGHLMRGSLFKSYAIATRDHFGHSLAELIESDVLVSFNTVTWIKKRAAVVTTQEQLNEFFLEGL